MQPITYLIALWLQSLPGIADTQRTSPQEQLQFVCHAHGVTCSVTPAPTPAPNAWVFGYDHMLSVWVCICASRTLLSMPLSQYSALDTVRTSWYIFVYPYIQTRNISDVQSRTRRDHRLAYLHIHSHTGCLLDPCLLNVKPTSRKFVDTAMRSVLALGYDRHLHLYHDHPDRYDESRKNMII